MALAFLLNARASAVAFKRLTMIAWLLYGCDTTAYHRFQQVECIIVME